MLTSGIVATGRFRTTAVARSSAKLKRFLSAIPGGASVTIASLKDFPNGEYDAVVNCLGIGDPRHIRSSGAAILGMTEQFDSTAMGYLAFRPDTRLISISSGAAYGGDFDEPASESQLAVVQSRAPAYRLLRNSQAGVRGATSGCVRIAHCRPAALRTLFPVHRFGVGVLHGGRISRYCRAHAPRGRPREYLSGLVGPEDLTALVVAVIEAPPANDVYDVYSLAPVEKFELLDALAARYGLSYVVGPQAIKSAATGVKSRYFSTNRRAASIGYAASQTSLQTILRETDALLEARIGARE